MTAITWLLPLALLLQPGEYTGPQEMEAVGPGIMCIGVWPNRILMVDKRGHKVVGEIKLETGVPEQLLTSFDQRRMIAITDQRTVEVIDLASRKVTGHFPVVEGNRQALVMSGTVSPQGRYLYLTVRSVLKEIDRYTLEKAQFRIYDLDQRKLVRTFDFAQKDDESLGWANSSYRVSEDDRRLYVFREDISIVDLETFKEIDKIELSKPRYSGDFAISLDGDFYYNGPALVTSVFSATDPLGQRPLSGIVRINLVTKERDVIAIGPAMPIRGSLFLSPDRKTAYAVVVNNSQDPNRRPEFWVVDLEARRLAKRVEFENRPRFTFATSSDARELYIWGPGAVIDVYNAETLKFDKTITVEGDITEIVVLRGRP